MSPIHVASECAPARTVSLQELFDQYLAKNPPKDRGDRDNVKTAFRLLIAMFPDLTTETFTAKHLLLFRNNLVKKVSEQTGKTFSIVYCNKLVSFVRAVFNWGMNPNLKALSETDIIPSLVSELLCFSLSKVPLLKPGDGRRNKERKDAPTEYVEALLQKLPPINADMMRIQLATVMRPGEVCKMRCGDIKKTKAEFVEAGHPDLDEGEVWLYHLARHKTDRYVEERNIPLDLEVQELLKKYLVDDPERPIFFNKLGNAFTTGRYSRIVFKTIEKHSLSKFVPAQLRHTGVSKTSKKYGRDTARALAGHTTETMTARYDHSDFDKALEVALEKK